MWSEGLCWTEDRRGIESMDRENLPSVNVGELAIVGIFPIIPTRDSRRTEDVEKINERVEGRKPKSGTSGTSLGKPAIKKPAERTRERLYIVYPIVSSE